MKTIDLTHTISEGIPVYLIAEKPHVRQAFTIEKNGYNEKSVTLYTHTGTHMDAPAHMIADGATLDRLPASAFLGSAAIIDCTAAEPDCIIGMEFLQPVRERADRAEFLIFHTGWHRLWHDPDAYLSRYPALGQDVVDYLLTSGKKGVGMDTASPDVYGSGTFLNHRRLLAGGVLIIENLANLDAVDDAPFVFAALPLKVERADGAPVRALAILR